MVYKSLLTLVARNNSWTDLTDNFTSLENVYSKHGRKIVRSVSRHGSGENSNCSILHEESKGLGPPSLLEGLEHSP